MKRYITVAVSAVFTACALIAAGDATGKKTVPVEEGWLTFVGGWMRKYGITVNCLMRVDAARKVLEMMQKDGEAYSDYPKKIDPKVSRIYEGDCFLYRRE